MKIVLLRHGRTQSNIERRYSGCRTDDPLSEQGRAELPDCTDMLADLGISQESCLIVTSPMKRAIETAGLMFPGLMSNPVSGCPDYDHSGTEDHGTHHLIIDDLREMDFGIFEGKNHEELDGDPVYQAWIDSGGVMQIPGGESREMFIRRSVSGFRAAVRAATLGGRPGAELIIVAHGGTVMSVMSTLYVGDYYDYYTANGAGYILDPEVDDAGNIIAAGTYDSFCGGVHS